MGEKYFCLRQFSRPSSPIPLFLQEIKGMGDCYFCKTDYENNKTCAVYFPIKIETLKLEE